MPGFLYYLPGQTVATCDRDALRAAGLEMVFREEVQSQRAFQEQLILHQVHANGPGERRSGVLVTVDQPGVERVGYYPAEQAWSDCGKFWLGEWRSARPEPADLSRPQLVSGYECVLGDQRAWTAPTIRRGGIGANLPRAMGLDPCGAFGLRVLPDWEWAWQLGQEIFDTAFGTPSVPYETVFRLCCACLSINYRVGPIEVSRLGLVTTDNFQRIFDAAIDWDLVQELLREEEESQKKSAGPAGPASVSISPGPGEISPATPPVSGICI